MIGFKLRIPTKAYLAALAWAVSFRAFAVLFLGWFVELLIGPGAGALIPYVLAIIAVGLVDIQPWLWAFLRRLWARLPRRKVPTVPCTTSATFQTSSVPHDAPRDRGA